VHRRAGPLKRDSEHQQASQQEEADPGEFTLLGFRYFQLRQAGCLDPKALPRGGALGARDALTPGFRT